jgi:hypothetical protein
VDSTVKLKPRKGETEIAAWYEWDTVKSDKRLIPNLLCIVPLCMAGVTGWFVNGTAVGDGVYDVTVRLLLDHPIPHKPEE